MHCETNRLTDQNILLNDFNNRDANAFGAIYSLFYEDLLYFSLKLYSDTNIDAQDAVHDAFVIIWKTKATKFENLTALKGYLFIVIKNEFNQYLKRINRFNKFTLKKQQTEQLFEYNIVESELLGYFNNILKLIPEDSAEVLKLFIEGWDADNIATKLNVNKQTVYNKKHEAIKLLKLKVKEVDLLAFILTSL